MPEASGTGAHHTILVVDDTPQNLSLMSDLLEDIYTVKLAPNGARALKIAATTPPDLILLDIMMPEMDGYEVCRQLKENPQTRDIPVIFLTAMDRIEDEEKALQQGAVDFVTKPISPAILLLRVRNQLSLKSATDQLKAQNAQLEVEKQRTRDLLLKIKEGADKILAHNRQMKLEQERARSLLLVLGESVQAAEQLDRVWEKLRQFPADPSMLGDLYLLAQKFEQQGLADRAKSVFGFIHERDAGFRDVAQRLAPGRTANLDGLHALGRYQLQRVLGQGAMGKVFLGIDPIISRVVAIKTMTFGGSGEGVEQEGKAQFFNEAESAGHLSHPNIAAIYDVGEEQGLAYIAMEFLKGSDLSAWTTPENRLPLDKVLTLVEQVALALGHAHAQGVIHRDIKPANLVYESETGSIKIADFGIASMKGSCRKEAGNLLGSPMYMSPEQVRAEAIDGRSDLYSLGATLYCLVAGHFPFVAASLDELLERILKDPPIDLRAERPDLPDCLHVILAKSLAKDSARRFQTGNEMAEALRLCRRSTMVFA